MSRWRLMIALWLVAAASLFLCEMGIRREPRTTYDRVYSSPQAATPSALTPHAAPADTGSR